MNLTKTQQNLIQLVYSLKVFPIITKKNNHQELTVSPKHPSFTKCEISKFYPHNLIHNYFIHCVFVHL